MLPRAATTLSRLSLHGREEWIQRRCYSSDPVIHSKEKIEALISGRISEKEFKKSTGKASKRPFNKKPWHRRKGDDDIPDWGLAAASNETNPVVESEVVQDVEEAAIEEFPELQGDLAEELRQLEQAAAQDGSIVTETASVEPAKLEREFITKKSFRDELIQSRSVSVAALGEKIDAIMLKNPNEMKRPKRPVRRVQEEARETTVELDAERDNMVDQKEESDEEAMAAAVKHIDDLRPVDRTILQREDFDSLANVLLEGFNMNQLARYFNQKRLAMSGLDLQKPFPYPWIAKQGPWVAAKPDHWGPLRPKQRQVIMIMQMLWNLEVKEQVEGLGRTLIWLKPRIFQLITPPNSFVLDQLSRDFLFKTNKEKITTSFDDYRINIYAQKSTIPVILSHLDDIVRSIRCQKISSVHIQEPDLDEDILRELEQITKTHIQYNKDNKELEVSWLEKKDLAPSIEGTKDTETPADIALRLLLEQPSKNDQSDVRIIAPSEISPGKDGTFINYQRERRSMSWRDKLRQWSRYVVPVGQTSAAGDDIAPQFLEMVSLPAPGPEPKKGNEPVRRIAASFGHVLHDKSCRTVAAMAKHRRLLSPVLPHPASFTSIVEEDKPMTQRATIILNFSPDPKQHPASSDSTPPKIQLQLPVDPDTDLAEFSLPPDSALFGLAAHHVSDILLPSEGVDVRLTQRQLLALDAGQESAKEFLSRCEFNLPKGILRTPSKATFSIPKAWTSNSKATTRRPSKATVNVPYTFMGLEIHQTIDLEFHGHTLRYSSIDAGHHGGHRQELSLQAGPPQSEDKAFSGLDEAEASHFLSLVQGIATGKYFSWHNGSQLMRETSDESSGLDALEEEASDDNLSLLEAEEYEDARSADSKLPGTFEQDDGLPDSENPTASKSTTTTDGGASEDSGSPNPAETKGL
ncbi:hypothetical protein TARUN_1208 [Trichoderma arundinaceum]|uniref:Uncharacterized protein n=1 Tax=Trichoderma arundinaceum TaxID=490622 RepID=A0A395NY98_TRIAR|nr:hypothetical protein TARUN_1208 [Trichoderma arundinaceum]